MATWFVGLNIIGSAEYQILGINRQSAVKGSQHRLKISCRTTTICSPEPTFVNLIIIIITLSGLLQGIIKIWPTSWHVSRPGQKCNWKLNFSLQIFTTTDSDRQLTVQCSQHRWLHEKTYSQKRLVPIYIHWKIIQASWFQTHIQETRGHPFMTSTKKSDFWPPLSTWARPPLPFVNVHMWST